MSNGKVTEKPWGREVLLEHNAKYALKDIFMRAGTRSSLQSHREKLETLLVLSGRIGVETRGPGAAEFSHAEYMPGDVYTVKPGTIHRVTVLEDCRLIEVSTPELDDLIRHEDDFNRR